MSQDPGLNPPRWPGETLALPPGPPGLPPRHVHVIWSLALGGAERIVADLAATLGCGGAEMDVVVLRDADAEHALAAPGTALHRLGSLPQAERLAYAAGVIRASRLPAYTHLLGAAQLQALWALGCRTVPVFHNTRAGWKPDPALLDVEPVPFVVACGDTVAAELTAAGLRKPVRVLRHVPTAPAPLTPARRMQLRTALGAHDGTMLLGMVGQLKPQKDYPRAVHVLARLRAQGHPARLAIIGPALDAAGQAARAETDRTARQLGVRDHLVMPGPVVGAVELAGCFDVFLNTSRFEGVSVATMEAAMAGTPMVLAEVGGQGETVSGLLMRADADAAAWADAVLRAARFGRVPQEVDGRARAMAGQAWPWMLAVGPGSGPRGRGVLFLTGNLDVGGAQRSLCNLVAELAVHLPVTVAVAGQVGVPGFLDAARQAGAAFVDVSGGGGLAGRAGRVLALAHARRPGTLAFWNMDAATKLLVLKVLAGGPVRVVDVSPGPMLFAELDAEAALGRALAMPPEAYLGRLDALVAKYPCGGHGQARHVVVIPNGVPAGTGPLPDGDGPVPPPGADPALAVICVGRLAPAKRPELLPLVARALARRVPGATLTMVGGLHEGSPPAGWQALRDAAGTDWPVNLVLAGPDHRTPGFLGRFACLLMVSTGQGCPNASLEAMEAGLPVVANPDGGTPEQVVHGVTGLLVEDPGEPAAFADGLAAALAAVLPGPGPMGAAAQRHVRARFSMAAMTGSYLSLFTEEGVARCSG